MINDYLNNLNSRFKTGIATEHTYRGDLQTLIESLAPGVMATNEPARIKCGAPDYIITKKDIPIGYIEAKDIGKSLDDKAYKEQFDRYRKSLGNLIITDYLDFRLYRDGEFVTSFRIADAVDGKIVPKPESFDQFTDLIREFTTHASQTIRSAPKLAKMMAGKARLLANVIENALTVDEANDAHTAREANNSLRDQMEAFKKILIHDIKAKEFADIYAQTIAYGMFAARLHDPTLEDFSRQEAAELIPKSNPFLRKLFQYIAGYDLDDRIKWIVDALADIFRATDVAALLNNFGKSTQQNDPIIHFYETFLAEYDPKLRKSRGVWYTPEPVVNFIVRAVDDILKSEFNLPQGLADTSKTKIEVKTQSTDSRYKEGVKTTEQEVHRVQILDPAAGTGTFLAEVVKHIYRTFEGQQGIWPGYVEEHLIPRLNGFELLMASYAMAHLKLDLLLAETGYKTKTAQRHRIYLTNSLEEIYPVMETQFAGWLSDEAMAANGVKRDTPVMVVLGNPPYSVSSSNKGEWIQNLIKDYKKDLNEKKLNLDDDYIKFIRYGQHFIEKNGEGILAYISNNSFIDGVTHRQMRKHLLETFDKIYILDLHGSSKKNETALDGSKDENVFDIMQGVSINLFIKNKKSNDLADVYHCDLYGSREQKYKILFEDDINALQWEVLNYKEPYFFFVPKDFGLEDEYEESFKLSELFVEYGSGVKNERDKVCIQFTEDEIHKVVDDFRTLSEDEIIHKYVVKDTRDWKVGNAKKDVIYNNSKDNYQKNLYRIFDTRHTYYTGTTRGFIGTPGNKRMRQFIGKNNLALVTCRQQSTFDFQHAFVSNIIADICVLSSQTKETGYILPLYLYPETSAQQTLNGRQERTPNLDREIVGRIAEGLGLAFTAEKEEREGTFAPIDILDYIYAVLHSPAYREKYKEFLKIDFPRVPYPENVETFWRLVKLGGELRQIHLLESPVVEKFITTYPIGGDNTVTRAIGKKDFEINVDVPVGAGFKPALNERSNNVCDEGGLQTRPYDKQNDDESVGAGLKPALNTLSGESKRAGLKPAPTGNIHTGRVWINDTQYFDNIPVTAWEFYIGGYQPAQKWLKDRKGRQLSYEDITHYQKIIVALTETARIMREIDEIEM